MSPNLQKNSTGITSPMDVTDVIDMKETLREDMRHEPVLGDDAPAGSAHGGNGVFLNAKPRVEPVTEAKGSLRSRFLNTKAKGTEGSLPAPVVEPDTQAPARTKWFAKRSAKSAAEPVVDQSTVAEAASEVPARPEGPVGPTAKVKTPIVVSRVSDKKKPTEVPIRVLIGFLAEVSEREAREYAVGVAERNCQQISLVYYDAFKFGNGCAYEIHEGGSGRAYLPEIIKAFNARGAFRKGGAEDASVFIQTATRMVQVTRTAEGLQAFLLPENTTEVPTTGLQGTSKMTPALPTLVAVLIAGAALFTTGFLALSVALIARVQPFEAPPAPGIEHVTDSFANSPLSRWAALQSVSSNEYVKAVRFANGKWEIQRAAVDAEPVAASAPLPEAAPVVPADAVPGAAPVPATPIN